MSDFTNRDVVFDEESMLQDKSETVNKVQGGALEVRQTLKKRELSSQRALKGLMGQKMTHIQMETKIRLLKSNLDR